VATKPERPIIIVKRPKKGAGGHHGGAWKVAYADFVTAMMAFFLVMWLVASVNTEQRAAIFEYFKNPSMEQGKSVKAALGQNGPGGASTSAINLRGGLDAPRTVQDTTKPGIGIPMAPPISAQKPDTAAPTPAPPAKTEDGKDGEEKLHLEALMKNLQEAISKSQALQPFKDQLLLDITPEGLRIQIVDAQNRPMFDSGSAELKDYTDKILREITPYLNSVPNRVSLTGHTDTTPYAGHNGHTNWELSSDRANAARRSLVAAGLATDKIARIVGLSSSVLFNKDNPRAPINRRISIILMTRLAEEQAHLTDVPEMQAPRPHE
jgi:chemotaxis protein MotB